MQFISRNKLTLYIILRDLLLYIEILIENIIKIQKSIKFVLKPNLHAENKIIFIYKQTRDIISLYCKIAILFFFFSDYFLITLIMVFSQI